MTDAAKQKFLVLYLIPSSVMADWGEDRSRDTAGRRTEDAGSMGEMDGRACQDDH